MEQVLLQKLKEISLAVIWDIVGDTKDIFSITDRLHSAAFQKRIVEVVQLIGLKEKDDAPYSYELIFKFYDKYGISRDFMGVASDNIIWKVTTTPYVLSQYDPNLRKLVGEDEDIFDWYSRFTVELYDLVHSEQDTFEKMMDYYFPDL
jgi:hypothetical protein